MGSSSLLDIIGSSIIGSLLLLTALRMNDTATTNTYQSQENLTIQQNLTSLVNNIEYDFRKLGWTADPFAQPQSDSMIIYGNSDSIVFIAQLAQNGPVDTVRWWLGDSAIAGCANQNVRMLYRKVTPSDGTAYSLYYSNLGVTQFNLLYFGPNGIGNISHPGDSIHVPIKAPNNVFYIEINLTVQPIAAYDTAYNTNFATWRQIRLTSMNLANR
jgi:hypothetical protein